MSFLLITLFYSGFGFNFAGLGALGKALCWRGSTRATSARATASRSSTGASCLVRAEPWAVFGLLACVRYLVPPLPRPTTCPGSVGLIADPLPGGGGVLNCRRPEWFHDARAAVDQLGKYSHRPRGGVSSGRLGILTVVAGLCGGGVVPGVPGVTADWRVRLLAVYGPGTLLAYSIIHYKTPWCATSFYLAVLLRGRCAAGRNGWRGPGPGCRCGRPS